MTKYLSGQPFSGPTSNGRKTDVEYDYAVGKATAEDVARERYALRTGSSRFDRLPPTERRKLIDAVVEEG